MPDLVIPGESGMLVPPAVPHLMAEALDTVLADPALADRLARRGQALAGRPFDAAGLAAVLDEVYVGALTATALSRAG